MKRNMGTVDKGIRILGGLAVLSFALIGASEWGYIGFVPLLTGLLGWCPLYSLLGISTCGRRTDNDHAARCAWGSKN